MTWFADTFYFVALINMDDAAHEAAKALTAELRTPIVTTDWVLVETADAVAPVRLQRKFLPFVEFLRAHKLVEIVPADRQILDEAIELYDSRGDKDWPLTDCISFTLMQERGIVEALTADRHFEQAGFVALMK
jgi:predicted nucleic acid-binding protein